MNLLLSSRISSAAVDVHTIPKVSSSSPPMDLPVTGSSPSPCLPLEPPDSELYVRLPVDPPDPPVPPPPDPPPTLWANAFHRQISSPCSASLHHSEQKGLLLLENTSATWNFNSKSKKLRALLLNLEASVLSPDNTHINSSLMESDDQRFRPSSDKAYWIPHGNADVQSFDLTKVYVLSLNPVRLISLVWYDVFNGSLMVYVHHLASVDRVHIAQSCDVVLEFVPLFCQLSQAIRVYTVSDPFLMNIRVISRQRRPFPTALSYGSRDSQLLLPANSFRQSSIENPIRSHPPMVPSVTYLLDE
ncbi:hypothetical protein HID58_062681, partial [Brassica napus]